jgi:hypothetical protein
MVGFAGITGHILGAKNMPIPTFSEQDARELVDHAQKAPLVNLHHGQHVTQLLQRFAEWFEHVNKPAKEPAKSGKPRQASPAGQPTDPAS